LPARDAMADALRIDNTRGLALAEECLTSLCGCSLRDGKEANTNYNECAQAHLTRRSSATAGEGACGCRFNVEVISKVERGAASGSLHRTHR
jgi:hypothetical protein